MSHGTRPATPTLRASRAACARATRVAVVAPASSWENRSELLRGVAALEAWGLEVRLGDHVNDRHGYMAGTDADRAADLHAALADPGSAAIVCLQGGYGIAAPDPAPRRGRVRRKPEGDLRLQRPHDAPPRGAALGQRDQLLLERSDRDRVARGDRLLEGQPEARALQRRALRPDRAEPGRPVRPDASSAGERPGGSPVAAPASSAARSGLGSSRISAAGSSSSRRSSIEGYILDGILTQLRNAGTLDGVAGIVVGDIKAKWSGRHRRAVGRGHRRGGARRRSACRWCSACRSATTSTTRRCRSGALATLDADAGTLVVEEVVTAD